MHINPNVLDCASAPIAEAWSWINNPDDPGLLDVCQAVPAYLPHRSMLEFLGDAVARGQAATYTEISGIQPLRQALAEDINNRYAAAVDADNIVITAGCNQGFCSVIDTLCQSGDNVIVPLPCYFNHEMWLSIRDINIQWLDFNDSTAEPDPVQADSFVNEKTRAIILISPNNPTGAIYSEETINAFYLVARKHGIPLVIDETYRDFMDDSRPPHSLFQQPGWQDTFIHLYSFSKAFSLTGHRVGAVVAGQPVLDQLTKIQDCVAISAPHIGQIAAQYGLENLTEWRRMKGNEMIARAAAIRTAFDDHRLEYHLISAGAYFAYIRHPFVDPSRKVAERLAREFKIVCLPGTYFGAGQEPFFRFAFANLEEDRFPELIDRLIASQV